MNNEEKLNKRDKFLKACKEDKDLTGFTGKKREALFALKLTKGNKSKSAMMVGVSRDNIYKWMEADAAFKVKVDEIYDIACEFVDDKLMSRVEDGDMTAIIWWDKTRGKHKDMVQKVDHTTNGKELPASQPLMFISSDQLSADQINAIINKDISGADSNDTGS